MTWVFDFRKVALQHHRNIQPRGQPRLIEVFQDMDERNGLLCPLMLIASGSVRTTLDPLAWGGP